MRYEQIIFLEIFCGVSFSDSFIDLFFFVFVIVTC